MSSKITIIGAGSVGATIAYNLSLDDIASEIVLIDVKKDKVDEFIKYVNENYAKEIGYEASFYKTSVENGAQEL